jgi:hypothetical protein
MNCKNCDTALQPEVSFCYECGAKVIKNRITFKNLLVYFGETFFNFDNKLLQTVINLIKDPKDVIDGYVKGVRKKYIEPLGFFAISLTLSGLYLVIIQKYFPDIFNMEGIYDNQTSAMVSQKSSKILTEYNSILNFIFIPAAAGMSWLIFLDKHYNFTEHAVMYFYTLSLFSITSVVITIPIISIDSDLVFPLSPILYLIFFIYMGYVLTNIFSLNLKQLIIKFLIFLPVFFVVYIVFSILLVVILFITGDLSLQDFQPPS